MAQLDFPSNPSTGQIYNGNGYSWLWDGTKWAPAGGQAGQWVPEAPSDNFLYSRKNAGWLRDPIQAEAPTDGGFYSRNNAAWALDEFHPDVAADGNFYARQRGLWVPAQSGGFLNKLRNGTFAVWQRGNAFTAAVGAWGFTADGWLTYATGVACPVNRLTVAGGNSQYSLAFTGTANNTDVRLWQRIESYDGSQLNGTVTVQFVIYNTTGATITPQVSLGHNTTIDNSTTAVQDLPYTAMQPCPSGGLTRVAYTYTFPVNVTYLGVNVWLLLPACVAGVLAVWSADIRATPGWPVGICNNPPPPELRPVQVETAQCQRYYEQSVNPGVAWTGDVGRLIYNTGFASAAGLAHSGWVDYKATKRVAPTLTIYNPQTGAAGTMYEASTAASYTATVFNTNQNGFSVYSSLTAAATAINLRFNWASNAEL